MENDIKNGKSIKRKKFIDNWGCQIIVIVIILIVLGGYLLKGTREWYYNRKCAKEVQQITRNVGTLNWHGDQSNSRQPVKPCVLLIIGQGSDSVKQYNSDAFNALSQGMILRIGSGEPIRSVVIVKLEDGGSEGHLFTSYEKRDYNTATYKTTGETIDKVVKVYSAKTWIVDANTGVAVEWEAFDVKRIPVRESLSPTIARFSQSPPGLSEIEISYRVIDKICELINK